MKLEKLREWKELVFARPRRDLGFWKQLKSNCFRGAEQAESLRYVPTGSTCHHFNRPTRRPKLRGTVHVHNSLHSQVKSADITVQFPMELLIRLYYISLSSISKDKAREPTITSQPLVPLDLDYAIAPSNLNKFAF